MSKSIRSSIAALVAAAALVPAIARAEVFINESITTTPPPPAIPASASRSSPPRAKASAVTASICTTAPRRRPPPPTTTTWCRRQPGRLRRQVRIATLSYPSNGIQNGANDGIALVNPSGRWCSSSATKARITASNGPAAGRTSTNMPVSETGSAAAGHVAAARRQRRLGQLHLARFGDADFRHLQQQPDLHRAQAAAHRHRDHAGQRRDRFPGRRRPGASASAKAVTPGPARSPWPAAAQATCTLTHATAATASHLHQHGAARRRNLHLDASRPTSHRLRRRASRAEHAWSTSPSPPASTGYYSHVNTSSAPQLRCSLHRPSAATPPIRTAAAPPTPGASSRSPTRTRTTPAASSTSTATAATPRAASARAPAPASPTTANTPGPTRWASAAPPATSACPTRPTPTPTCCT